MTSDPPRDTPLADLLGIPTPIEDGGRVIDMAARRQAIPTVRDDLVGRATRAIATILDAAIGRTTAVYAVGVTPGNVRLRLDEQLSEGEVVEMERLAGQIADADQSAKEVEARTSSAARAVLAVLDDEWRSVDAIAVMARMGETAALVALGQLFRAGYAMKRPAMPKAEWKRATK